MTPSPLDSVVAWMLGVGHRSTPGHLKLYEALCMEEAGEQMAEFAVVCNGSRDADQQHFATAMRQASKVLREHAELGVEPIDANRLVDAHLDSAWVHLCAAGVLVGPERLGQAWARLHNANVTGKQVDGEFVLDPSGKVRKPPGWIAPDYTDLIHEEFRK